jgi:long-chain acyl-CoA synthetase
MRTDQFLLGYIPTKNARLFRDKTAIVFKDRRFTFRQVADRCNRLANGLRDLGVSPGEKVAVLLSNCSEYVELYFAIPKIGATIVPLNTRFIAKELLHVLRDSEAETLVLGSTYVDIFRSLASQLKGIKRLVCLDAGPKDMTAYETLIKEGSTKEPDVAIDEEDVAFLMYTGGTTGMPKGVMLSHRSMMSSNMTFVMTKALCSWKSLADGVVLITTPIYHIGSMGGTLMPSFYAGATCIIMERFDPLVALETIERERVTYLPLYPVMFRAVMDLQEERKHDISSLEIVAYGSAPLSPEILKRAIKVFGCDFHQGFGQTECSACYVSFLGPEDHRIEEFPHLVERLSSVGRESLNAVVGIVNDKDQEVPPGEVGEIVVRGPHLMKGYWRMPELTAETMRGGWLHTGDMGRMDKEGYIYLVDRRKDMIISGSYNIFPKEIETVLLEHPAIQKAAVIGVPHEKWGETVKAICTLKEGAKVTEEEVIAFCRENMASFKKPTSVEFVKELPMTSLGKLNKVALREKYWKGHERRIH